MLIYAEKYPQERQLSANPAGIYFFCKRLSWFIYTNLIICPW